jgi:MFS family permease
VTSTLNGIMLEKGFKNVIVTAVVVAFSLLGDSFLYVGLPLEFDNLGLSLVSVGLLLSINRFVRFFSNIWAGYMYNRCGIKLPFVVAICIGTSVTFSYGLAYGFLPFLFLRAIWGVSWSFLRLPAYLLVADNPIEKRGTMMGFYQSIAVIGSFSGTLIGGILLDFSGFNFTILILTLTSTIGIPVAFTLNDNRKFPVSQKNKASINLKLMFGDSRMMKVGLSTMVNNLFLGSILISTLSLFLLEVFGERSVNILGLTLGIATLSGFLIAMQRLSRIVTGFFLGRISDLFGYRKTIFFSFLGGIVGMTILGLSFSVFSVVLAVLISFISSSALGVVLATKASDIAAIQQEGREYVISSYTNWVDLGSASGPLVAYILRLFIPFRIIYLTSTLVLILAAVLNNLYYIKKAHI